jgi:Tripartite tricarboxylate transporter TctB family
MRSTLSATRRTEVAFVLVLVLGALTLFLATPSLISGFDPAKPFFSSPGLFPRLSLAIIVLFGIGELARLVRAGKRALSDEIDVGASRVLIAAAGAALFGLYILLAIWIGYLAATVLFVAVTALIAGVRTRTALSIAAVVSGLLYTVFVYGFKVWFPAAALFS